MATFTLSGRGIQALTAGTGALHVDVTTLPALAGFGNANPVNRYSVGLLRPGDGTGFWDAVPVTGGPQRLDLPRGATQVGYSIFSTGKVTLTEVAGTSAEPWDRKAADVTRSFGVISGANQSTTAWTYTVTAGRQCYVSRLMIRTQRQSPATTVSGPYMQVFLSGTIILTVQIFANTVGAEERDSLDGGPLYLSAGSTLSCTYQNPDTGGAAGFWTYLAGFEFV